MFKDTVGWLASDPSGGFAVMVAEGYKPRKVSTDALESAFTQWANLPHATAMTYTQDAHPFYLLNAPAQQTSVCFDGETGAWHDRAWLAEDGSFERWRGEVNTFGFQRHLVGDFEDGRIYDMRLDHYLDDERAAGPGAGVCRASKPCSSGYGIACFGCAWMRVWASTAGPSPAWTRRCALRWSV